MASYINPRGRQVLDGWDFDDNQNQALLKDIQRKWREWEESPLEQKQSYSERRERDKERLGLVIISHDQLSNNHVNRLRYTI